MPDVQPVFPPNQNTSSANPPSLPVQPVFPTYNPPPGPEPATPPPPQIPPTFSPPGRQGIPSYLFILGAIVIIFLVAFFAFKFLSGRVGLGQNATLTYWGLWEPESVMQPIIDKYQQAHPGVKIQYILQSPQDYRERLTNSLDGGNGPDIFRFHNTWVPMLQNSLAPVPAKVFDATSFKNTFYPVALTDMVAGNKIMGVPTMYDGLALFYNTDVFQQAGKTPPTDWNDLRKTAIELTVRDDLGRIKTAGVALGTTGNVDHWQDILALMMLQNGVDLDKPTGKNAEDALTFYTIFSTLDHVWDDTLPNSTASFIQGRLAMYFGPSWRAFDFEEAKKSQNPNLHYAVLPVPQLPDTNVTWASYWAEGVSKNSKNAAAAWDFVQYLSSKDTLQALYQAQSQIRLFGELYPRSDMASLLKSNPVTGVYIGEAPNAKSWYLASFTDDGPSGLNSRISAYFNDAVNGMNNGGSATDVLSTVASGVTQVLSDYKIPIQ